MKTLGGFLLPALLAPAMALAAPCNQLKNVVLGQGTVTAAVLVTSGRLPAAGGGDASTLRDLPAFCRVEATLRPSPDSDIKVEAWLPAAAWNGKLQAVGNGGWGGSIGYNAMAEALRRGYATSSSDTGHRGGSAQFALAHPEKMIDYSYRATHEMTVAAKTLVAAFYGSAPRWSYFNGCSTGGRQALIEAQRFPEDFDGIIAGAAANPKANLDSWRIWMAQAMLKDASSFIPPAKYPTIHRAVMNACDHLDGVTDGLIESPLHCQFDAASLACGPAGGDSCLTASQVAAAAVVMNPVRDRKTGELIFPRLEPGTERDWARLLGGPGPYEAAIEQFKYIVFSDPAWDWRTFELERDLAAASKSAGGALAAVSPDLTRFAQRHGKLLMYHGWADPSIAPQASVNYYTRALGATTPNPQSTDWLRLFMVPGMGHCRGGAGPDVFDAVSALETWVEKGVAPASMQASRISNGKVERTRPLCPYPQVARYNGTGSIDDAANFSCQKP
jgi:feruloyl esterase